MNIVDPKLSFKPLSYNLVPVMLVLHHAEASNCTIEDIHRWHSEKGWAGCGYHYFVRKDGTIYKGRPESAIGSHCLGANDKSIGVCAEGTYMSEVMPDAQRRAIIELGRDITNRHGIKQVYGHRELKATQCPGTNYPLDAIKQTILSKDPIVEKVERMIDDMDIKDLQTFLNNMGVRNDIDGQPLKIDGDEGKRTKSAKEKAKEILGYILK